MLSLIPNSYPELPTRAEFGKAAFDDDVGDNYDKLVKMGKISTILRYVIALVVLLVLMVSEILRNSEVLYTVKSPSFAVHNELKSDAANRNFVCRTQNAALKYGDFLNASFELHQSCDWVVKDLLKPQHPGGGWNEDNIPGFINALRANVSACRSTELSPSRMHTCLALRDGCNKGSSSLSRVLEQLEATLLPTTTLLEEDTLGAIVSTLLNSTVESVLQSSRQSTDTVLSWASHSMPRLYAYLRIHRYRIQALSYKSGNDAVLVADVNAKCTGRIYGDGTLTPCVKTKIGDGTCDRDCMTAGCLYDGGDCFGNGSNNEITEPQVLSDHYTYDSENLMGYDPVSWSGSYKGRPFDGGALEHNFLSHTDGSMQTFDNSSCGDNTTWANTVEMDYYGEGVVQQVIYINTSALNSFLLSQGYSIAVPPVPVTWGSTHPSINHMIPIFEQKTFSCDSWVRAHQAISYANMTSFEIAKWMEYYDKVGSAAATLMSTCAVDLYIYCPVSNAFYSNELKYYSIGAVDANWAWMSATVKENSGSVLDLMLDAALKRNSSGYAISAPISYEHYYNAAQVEECSYTQSVRTSSAALLSIIFGLIGGIFALSETIGLIIYTVLRRRVISQSRKA